MRVYFQIVLSLVFLSTILFSCESDVNTTENKSPLLEDTVAIEFVYSTKDSVFHYSLQGEIELAKFDVNDTLTEHFPSDSNFYYIAYPIICSGECYGESILFSKRAVQGVSISEQDYFSFLAIIQNTESYGNSQAACYNPMLSIVAYKADSVPNEVIGVCMDCNRIETYPTDAIIHETIYANGLNEPARLKLTALFQEWGISYYTPYFNESNEVVLENLRDDKSIIYTIENGSVVLKDSIRISSNDFY